MIEKPKRRTVLALTPMSRSALACRRDAGATACSKSPSPGGGTAGTTGAGGGAGSSSTAGTTGTGGSAGTTGTGGSAGTAGTGGSAGTAGTGGSAGSADTGGVDAATDGGPFCSQPLEDCAYLSVAYTKHDTSYCTLSDGVAAECQQGGFILPSLVQGARYTYIDILYADVGTRLVYDASGALIAELGYSNNTKKWMCFFGPSDFDPTDVMATPFSTSFAAIQAFRDMCAARADAGPDGPSP